MDEQSGSNRSVAIVCPSCHRQTEVAPECLGNGGSPVCRYCGVRLVSSDCGAPPAGEGAAPIEIARATEHYVVGSGRKRSLLAPLFRVVKLAVLALAVAAAVFLGGGRIHDTYFIAVKKTPGLENYYVTGELDTVYGQYVIDRQIARKFSFIVLKYNEQIGLVFFRKL